MKIDSFSCCCAADDDVLQVIKKEFWHGTIAVEGHCHANCFAGMTAFRLVYEKSALN